MNAHTRIAALIACLAAGASGGCGGGDSAAGAGARKVPTVDCREVMANVDKYVGKVVESPVCAMTGVIGDFYSTLPGRQEGPLVLFLTMRQSHEVKELVKKYGHNYDMIVRYRVHANPRTHGELVSLRPARPAAAPAPAPPPATAPAAPAGTPPGIGTDEESRQAPAAPAPGPAPGGAADEPAAPASD